MKVKPLIYKTFEEFQDANEQIPDNCIAHCWFAWLAARQYPEEKLKMIRDILNWDMPLLGRVNRIKEVLDEEEIEDS